MTGAAERRAVMVCPEAPFPVRGGGPLRTASLVHYLAQRFALDLIVFREPGAPDPREVVPAGLVRRVSVIELPATRKDPVGRALRNVTRYVRKIPPHEDRFRGFALPLDGRYHLGLVEHFWCSSYLDQLRPACETLVLDLHNIESEFYARRAATEPGALGKILRAFGEYNRALETERLGQFDALLVTSADDARLVKHRRTIVYPNAIPEQARPVRGEEPVVAFSGNLEFPPNLTGIAWFRDQVWPSIVAEHPEVRWRLIGKNPGAAERILQGVHNVQLTGEVEDAVAELARCRVAVVPILSGSGTRLKIVEAWAAGTPVVSTPLGAEGLRAEDGRHLLLGDGAAAFGAAVRQVLSDAALAGRVGAAGRARYEAEYTWPAAWKSLTSTPVG